MQRAIPGDQTATSGLLTRRFSRGIGRDHECRERRRSRRTEGAALAPMPALQGTADHPQSIRARADPARTSAPAVSGNLTSNSRTTVMILLYSFRLPARSQASSRGRRAGVCLLAHRDARSESKPRCSSTFLPIGVPSNSPSRTFLSIGVPSNSPSCPQKRRSPPGRTGTGRVAGYKLPFLIWARRRTWTRDWPSPAWRRRCPRPSTVGPPSVAAVRGGRRRLGAVAAPCTTELRSARGQQRIAADER